ncbi:MAG TPA: HAMP domain-containing sensor histidine kinase [Gemmatimonadaceae bacterium]|nr:HAMP domain-containing sensor histidine kinase [Gemmatimonadaceae bacterium]
MADVSGAVDSGQSIGREEGARVGLGLLSRFIGAVFLVLLGGLLLLDRALQRANYNQAELDSQSAALLTESFVANHAMLLDRVAELTGARAPVKDSAEVRARLERLLSAAVGVREIWVDDTAGHSILSVVSADVRAPHQALRDSLHHVRALDRSLVVVPRGTSGSRWIALVRGLARTSGGGAGTVGLLVAGDSLEALLTRARPDTRLSLAVLAGMDTVVRLGEKARSDQPPGGRPAVLVRLPNGGTWRVVAVHALTSRSLRWGLWTLGVMGVVFLALGLLREQQRAIQVADRSAELERLYSDVKRANQAKSEFLANVSHELRTPLNAIVGFVELLRDGFYGDLSPRQVPPVDRIAASATHLRHLVDQVLDIAKIAAGRLEVHAETIVLRPFVLNVASELESLVSEKGLAFSITVGASLPRVRTDPTHLRQILINLIGNAVKYTPTGTVSVRARLVGAPPVSNAATPPVRSTPPGGEELGGRALLARAPRSGTWVALQVVDSGVGIAAADLERIFDEFEQVNAGPRGDSMQRGTGLGLAISRRLARLLGGEISVESEVGRGSTFTVWLPVNPADLTRERAAVAAGSAPTTDPVADVV